MPAVVVVAAATGASAAIGTAVAGIVGATVSTAVATAIGSGLVSAAVTAAQGGNASQILTSAVVGGVSSGIGSAVSGAVAGAAQSAAQSAGYTAISHGFGQIAGGIAGGAASGATAAYMTGQSVKDAALSGGMYGGLGSALQVGYDYLTAPKVDTSVGFAPNTTSPEGGYHTTTDLAKSGLNSGRAGDVPAMYGDDLAGYNQPTGVETNPILAGQKPGLSNVRVVQAQGPANQIDTGAARTNILTGKDAAAAVNARITDPVYSPTAQLKLDNAYRSALSTTPGVTTSTTTAAAPAAPAAPASDGFLATAMDKLSDPWVAVPLGLSLLGSKQQQPQTPSGPPPLNEQQQALKDQFYEPLPTYTLDRNYIIEPNVVDWNRYGREEPGSQQFLSDAYYKRAKEGGSIKGYADGGSVQGYANGGMAGGFARIARAIADMVNPPTPPSSSNPSYGDLAKSVVSIVQPSPYDSTGGFINSAGVYVSGDQRKVMEDQVARGNPNSVFTKAFSQALVPQSVETQPSAQQQSSIPTPSQDTVVPSSSLLSVVDPSSYLSSGRRPDRSLVDSQTVEPYKYVPRARSFLSMFRDNPDMFQNAALSQAPRIYAKGGEVDSYSDTGRLNRFFGGKTTGVAYAVNPGKPAPPGTVYDVPFGLGKLMSTSIMPAFQEAALKEEASKDRVPVYYAAEPTPTPSPDTVVPSSAFSNYLTSGRRTDRSLIGNPTIEPYKYTPRPRSFLSMFRDNPRMVNNRYEMQSPNTYGYAMGGEVNDSGINPANFNQVPDTNQTNYYTYGSIPQKGQPMMMKKGGISDGRTDDIPALLSDGEYVIDAETVALLGNGSSEAGSKQLDHMRQQIRKQKGGALAKGQFSPDAKSPLAYLKQRTA